MQLRHVSTTGKNLLNINISSTCPHNRANFGPLTAEIGLPVWGTPGNLTSFSFWFSYCSDIGHWTSTKLYTMFGRLLGCYTIHIFSEAFPQTEFCQVQNSRYIQVLCSPALLHSTPAAGVSQTLRRGTMNGIMELSQWAPPTFGWAAITLGSGPHF